MILDITLLNSTIDITPLAAVHRKPLALPSLHRAPPSWQKLLSRFCKTQELLEQRNCIVSIVNADCVPAVDILVFHSHSERVDEKIEDLSLGAVVEEVVVGKPEHVVEGMKAWAVESSRSLRWVGRRGRAWKMAGGFVALPVSPLAVARAVECCLAFCTALELFWELGLELVAVEAA